MTQPTKHTRVGHAASAQLHQEASPRTQTAPKRYAHAYIRHFIIFALFVPGFYSYYGHDFYQDVFPTGVLALLFTINIIHKWSLDFRRNRALIISLGAAVVLYNLACFYTYRRFADSHYWKSDQINITIAFLFLLTLLTLKDTAGLLTTKLMRMTLYAIVISNGLALIVRLLGYSRVLCTNLYFRMVPIEEIGGNLHWLQYSTGEYAFLLLLYMAFLMTYRKLFPNVWVYALSQGLLLICLVLTHASGALIAAGFLFGGQLLHYIINRFPVLRENILLIAPVIIAMVGGLIVYLFLREGEFKAKLLLWLGSLEVIRDTPGGFSGAFGITAYETNYLNIATYHPQNTFLTHMLRYSAPVGIMFTLLFVVLIIFSIIRRPNFRTLGIWAALFFMLNIDYTLQTLNLPLTLFMIYCIFFRPKIKETGSQ